MGKISDISNILSAELAAGKYPAGSRFPSEYELAERFGTGRVTVNKAVSLLVAEGKLVRGVRGSGTRVKACSVYPRKHVIYLGKIVHMFFSTVVQGIYTAAALRDYGVEVALPQAEDMENYLDKVCASGRYAGIITCGYGILDSERWKLPIVYVDSGNPFYDPAWYHVANHNQQGAFDLTQAVMARGYREIVIYTNCDYLSSHRYYRVNGFLDAMRAGGLENVDERLFVGLEYSIFDAQRVLKNIRKRFPQVQVIMTPTDDLALELVKVIRRERIENIFVTGFGNVQGISDVYDLPSVDQHPFYLGSDSCNLLLDIYEKKPNIKPHIQYVDADPVNVEALPFLK